MGQAMSTSYGHLRRLLNRYNAEYRAHKFLDTEKLPSAPRHPTKKTEAELLKERPNMAEEFKELYEKHPLLNEYLKKVYLTSTPEEEIKSSRPLPQRRIRNWKQLFYEPEEVTVGHCTISQIGQMINKNYEDPVQWDPAALAREYKLDKNVIIKILSYHSLLRVENFDFMQHEEEQEELVEKKQIEFEVFTALEKKPIKQIGEGKK